ncbi:MAG: hypothetical protein IPP71_17735 [Bacteroidetes bacterium]|nr:hypothetical protein [Bacteroidota bacterium]
MKQTSSSLLMIRPSHFGYNIETASTNSFQTETSYQHPEKEAIIEFNTAMHIFQNAGIRIIDFNDRPSDQTPDAIFPNNWVSFHENGKVILYPMEAVNREEKEDRI